MTAHAVLGKSIVRVDGREKVTGQTRYTGDLQLPGMLYAKLVLSLHAHARIARTPYSPISRRTSGRTRG